MIIHSLHRGELEQSIAETREFNSLKECLSILIEEHNKCMSFKITMDDIYIVPYGDGDNRVGWNDIYNLLCFISISTR